MDTGIILFAKAIGPIMLFGAVIGIRWLVTRRWRDADGAVHEATQEEAWYGHESN